MAFAIVSCTKDALKEDSLGTMDSRFSELEELEEVCDSIVPAVQDINSNLFDLLKQSKNVPLTKAESTEDDGWTSQGLDNAIFDLRDLPVHILVNSSAGGRYLTARRDWIHKWYEFHRRYFPIQSNFRTKIDNDYDVEAQTFYLSYVPLTGQYIIRTQFEGTDYYLQPGTLSSAPNDYVLYADTDGSSYQRSFYLRPVNGDNFYMESYLVGSDNPNSPTPYNVWNYVAESKSGNGHFAKYTGGSNQLFSLEPVGNFEVVRVEYYLDNTAVVEQIPDYVATWHATNNTDSPQQGTAAFSRKAETSSSFSVGHGVSMTVSAEFTAKTPYVDAKAGLSLTQSSTQTWGKVTTETDTRSYDFPLTIPPHSRVVAYARVTRHQMKVRYTAYLRDQKTGREIRMNGYWEGVDCTDIETEYEQYDLRTNTRVKALRMKGVPKTIVNP